MKILCNASIKRGPQTWVRCEHEATVECVIDEGLELRTYRCDEHAPRSEEFPIMRRIARGASAGNVIAFEAARRRAPRKGA